MLPAAAAGAQPLPPMTQVVVAAPLTTEKRVNVVSNGVVLKPEASGLSMYVTKNDGTVAPTPMRCWSVVQPFAGAQFAEPASINVAVGAVLSTPNEPRTPEKPAPVLNAVAVEPFEMSVQRALRSLSRSKTRTT